MILNSSSHGWPGHTPQSVWSYLIWVLRRLYKNRVQMCQELKTGGQLQAWYVSPDSPLPSIHLEPTHIFVEKFCLASLLPRASSFLLDSSSASFGRVHCYRKLLCQENLNMSFLGSWVRGSLLGAFCRSDKESYILKRTSTQTAKRSDSWRLRVTGCTAPAAAHSWRSLTEHNSYRSEVAAAQRVKAESSGQEGRPWAPLKEYVNISKSLCFETLMPKTKTFTSS